MEFNIVKFNNVKFNSLKSMLNIKRVEFNIVKFNNVKFLFWFPTGLFLRFLPEFVGVPPVFFLHFFFFLVLAFSIFLQFLIFIF